MEQSEILRRAFDHMPIVFSSYRFCSKCRQFGMTDLEIEQKVCSKFLKSKADKTNVRSWKKKPGIRTHEEFLNKIKSNVDAQLQTKIEASISFLKENGYKIMKQTLTFEEI